MSDSEEREPTNTKIIEIEVPGDQAIYFYEKAIKAGMEDLQEAVRFMPEDCASSARDAIYALSKFHEAVVQVNEIVREELMEEEAQLIRDLTPKSMLDDEEEDDDLD